jgi:raffinose/stachyose/melibiose transport system permease protein
LTRVENVALSDRKLPVPSRWVGSRFKRRASSAGLVIVTLIVLLPVLLMLADSLRPASAFTQSPVGFPTHPAWSNYASVFTSMDYLRSVGNTLLITVPAAALTVAAGSLAAWGLARRTRHWTRRLYGLFVAGLTAPVFVILTPLYLLMKQLGLLNTFQGLVLIYTALCLPLAVFFYTSFLRSIPLEIEEAAVCDGASPWRVFLSIVFPLLRPASATLSIFVTLLVWNDLVMPLVMLTGVQKSTVILSAYSFVGSFGAYHPWQLFPAMVLASLPLLIVFILLQRHIIAGMVGGVKA